LFLGTSYLLSVTLLVIKTSQQADHSCTCGITTQVERLKWWWKKVEWKLQQLEKGRGNLFGIIMTTILCKSFVFIVSQLFVVFAIFSVLFWHLLKHES